MPPRTSPFFRALFLPALLSSVVAAPSQTPPTTIQTRTNLVIEDVVVTDRAGKPVHGLSRADFTITEKGQPQQIRSFDEHAATPPPPPQPPLNLPPGIFTNYAPAPTSPALNVLLFDTLNTPLTDQAFARRQILKYIRSAPSGQRLAIFGLTTQLILLQGFTSDPAILRAAIDRKSVRASTLLSNATSGDPSEGMSDTLTNLGATSGARGAEIAQASANMRQFQADNAAFMLQVRAGYTLEALGTLARYLSALPGRKNILWFSGSFPLNIFPDASLGDPFRAAADLSPQLRETANVLTHAQVAVYPIDARGLFTDPTFDASNDGHQLISGAGSSAALERFNQQTAAEHATMREMAEQTGGRAFINTNGLAEAVAHALDDGSNFYTLTYSPTDTRFDGSYRKVELKLTGPRAAQGLSLAYRHGYYAVDPNARPRRPLPAPAGAPVSAPSAAFHAAMLRGAPPATDVIFKVAILPSDPPSTLPTTDPAPGNQPNPKLAKGPFRTYTVDFGAFPAQLLTRDAGGNYVGSIRFITLAYTADGTVVNFIDQTTRINIPPASYQGSPRTGIVYRQRISVPVKGEFFLRVGIGNLNNDHIGSLEVPLAAVKNLAPAPASPTPATP